MSWHYGSDNLPKDTVNISDSLSDFAHIINGKPVTSPTFLDVMNPATQKNFAKVPIATKEQLDEAVAAARAAFPGWAATPVDERAKIVNQIGDVITQNAETYKNMIVLEQGRPMCFTQFEIDFAANWCHNTATLRVPDTVPIDNEQQKIIQRYVPLGVCACISPWNGPLMLGVMKLVAALQAGNTVLMKPSPFTPMTMLRFIKDIQHLVPPGVVSVLSGDDNLGPMITAHPGINKISFTGSSFTGQKVMQSASVGLKRVTLELGGNDPMIILPDVDIKALVPETFWGAFRNSGAGCINAKRIYVHETIYDEFHDALVEYAKTVKVGNGMDPDTKIGPIQNLNQFKKIMSYFDEAHAQGFKFALGGHVDPNPTNGLFVPVTIIDNPPDNSKIVREEQFAPIMPLLKWNDEKDVVARANDTSLGLASSVWGKNLEVVERIALQIQAGTVSMNQFIPFTPGVAFPFHKQSGLGAEGGVIGLKSYSELQTITLKKNPAVSGSA